MDRIVSSKLTPIGPLFISFRLNTELSFYLFCRKIFMNFFLKLQAKAEVTLGKNSKCIR